MENTVVVLRAFLNHETYTRLAKALISVKNLGKEMGKILRCIGDFYERYPDKTDISLEELQLFFFEQNPAVDKEKFIDEFNRLSDAEKIHPDLVHDVLARVVEQHTCSAIYQVAINVVQGLITDGLDQIREIISAHEENAGKTNDPMDDACVIPIGEILNERIEGAIPWGLKFLNDTLGPLQLARLGHIFCRPDVGKTTMALSQIAYMTFNDLKQGSKKHFLYMNNEESIKVIRSRLYCSLTGWSLDVIHAHPAEAEQRFKERGGNNIHLFGNVLQVGDVEKYIQRVRPVVAVIDQGPKLLLPGKDLNEVEKRQQVYNRLRMLAIKYQCAIISLGQADSASENKLYPGLNNLDGSKVGIPGELDWCLAIGMKDEAGYESVRYLNVCKNKLTGKTGKGFAFIDVPMCRFKDSEEPKK